jgi:2-polyprenyl-3-methyl-5-hydroxy-6-metoxy-1,4-benzoquinol methylase
MSFEEKYWQEWYSAGNNSGQGSMGELLEFKAAFINKHLEGVNSVFDFGCGDGSLSRLLNIENYFGIDVSKEIVSKCNKQKKKTNHNYEQASFIDINPEFIKSKIQPEALMCIDALYHVMDNSVVDKTLENLFSGISPLVILYTIPNEKMSGEKIGAINFYDNSKKLSKITQDWKLVEETKPRGISGAAFFVWSKNAN